MIDSRILRLRLAVPHDLSGRCLSDILVAAARVSEEVAARMVRFGAVRVDGRVERDPGHPVASGSRVFLLWSPRAAALSPTPRLVYHDSHVWIVCKPAGIPVQATRLGSANSVEEYLIATAGRRVEPRIVHRLDLPVSGLMVAAATAPGAAGIARGFEDGLVSKVYLAVVRPVSDAAHSLLGRLSSTAAVELDQPLLWVSSKQKTIVSPDGKPSRSRVAFVAALPDHAALLAVRLLSGRTHQIRAHLSHAGVPVLGDSAYGALPTDQGSMQTSQQSADHGAACRPSADARRIALHSSYLALPHPVGGGPLRFKELPEVDFWSAAGIEPPPDLGGRFRGILEKLGCVR